VIREYDCQACGERKKTDKPRGPVPTRCDPCKEKGIVTQKILTDSLTRRPDARSIASQEKVQRALEMRRDFMTWDQIAKACGYPSRFAAHSAAKQEMIRRQATINDTLDEIRDNHLERLEQLGEEALKILRTRHLVINAGTVVVDPATGERLIDDGPSLAAIDRLIKINESSRKLLGLDAAQKAEHAVQVQYTVAGIADEEMP
jgi:hypothetical protein